MGKMTGSIVPFGMEMLTIEEQMKARYFTSISQNRGRRDMGICSVLWKA